MKLIYLLEMGDGKERPIPATLNNTDFPNVICDIESELVCARANFPPFNSAHEGYAILAEEVSELWAHVKTKQKERDLDAMKQEAIQVAAMAIRFAMEVCDETTGRK